MEKSILLIVTLSVLIYAVHCQLQTLVDVSTEAGCTQSPILNPSGDNRWAKAGLDVYIDTYITCGDIIAFQLEWFPVGSRKWSGWFVVGVNDVDSKSDGPSLTLKRMWSYFADHRHTYIICTQNKFIGCSCNLKAGFLPDSAYNSDTNSTSESQENSAYDSDTNSTSESQENSAYDSLPSAAVAQQIAPALVKTKKK